MVKNGGTAMKNKVFKKLTAVFLTVLMVVLAISVSAESFCEVYYIDSVSGDDLNSGKTQSDAWKSTENLKTLELDKGDSVLFKRGGEYFCELTLSLEGSEDAPITIGAYGDEDASLPHLYTDNRAEVFRLFDCSYLTVENLEITAHNGGGIWIDAYNKTSVGITLQGLDMHDMQNYKVYGRDDFGNGAAASRACVMVKGLPAKSRYAVNDLTITDCEMYDCGNGTIIFGSWNDEQNPWCEFEEIDPIYNEGVLIENVYYHDMDAEAAVIGICDGALVTHCRSINCCQGEGTDENGKVLYYTAAMWFWGSENSTIEYTEIAGQKNVGDGMTVDFDSYSNNCTYQYIYSHDNVRFVCNNPFYDGHKNNTVRYCLSVNDNKGRNAIACRSEGEWGLKFYNNTIVNSDDFQLRNLYNSVFANNIITFKEGAYFIYDGDAVISKGNKFYNNCYFGCNKPLTDLFAYNINPGFSGTDETDINSFTLSAASPLIGKGKVIEGAPDIDFFGNKITSNNVGCYGGNGTDTPYKRTFLICRILNFFKYLLNRIKQDLIYLINKYI